MQRILVRVAFSAAFAVCAACGQNSGKGEPSATTAAPAAAPAEAPAAPKVPKVFRGKVEKVDGAAKILTVNGENVEGWMSAMTMDYAPDDPAIFGTVKVGDVITAQVFDGDFSTLHDVKVVTPANP